jgi:hypothetical protein
MNTQNSIITRFQSRTRKLWLFSTFTLLVLNPLAYLVFFAILSAEASLSKETLIAFLACTVKCGIPMLIIWHCAYRRYGTKLLTLWLFMTPFNIFALILAAFLAYSNVWVMACILIELFVCVWWFIISLKMRTINKTIRAMLLYP